MAMYSKTCNQMRWPDMALCGLHDHIICPKYYLFGQAKPGLHEFADVVSITNLIGYGPSAHCANLQINFTTPYLCYHVYCQHYHNLTL
jgi:hypothetical protein